MPLSRAFLPLGIGFVPSNTKSPDGSDLFKGETIAGKIFGSGNFSARGVECPLGPPSGRDSYPLMSFLAGGDRRRAGGGRMGDTASHSATDAMGEAHALRAVARAQRGSWALVSGGSGKCTACVKRLAG